MSRASRGTETRPVVWHLQEVLSVEWVHVLLDDVHFSTEDMWDRSSVLVRPEGRGENR